MLKFEACVRFEVPDDTTSEELAHVLDYIGKAVDKFRYQVRDEVAWRVEKIDVPSFRALTSDEDIGRAVLRSVAQRAAAPVDDEVSRYFKSIGFDVTWDFRGFNRWHEIYDGNELLLQIDMGPSLADILADLPLLAEGKKGVSKSDYLFRGSHENLRKVAARVAAAQKLQVAGVI